MAESSGAKQMAPLEVVKTSRAEMEKKNEKEG
jgi:hypothetical protein